MTDLLFLLKKIITPLVLPPTGPLLFALLGMLLLGRWPRFGKLLTWSALLVLLVLCLPVTAALLANAVAVDSRPTAADLRAAQAIVILGGGRKAAPEYGGMTLSALALERARYGAKLARETRLPVLVTGGNVFGSGPSEAQLMAQTLRESFDTDTRWIEGRARDTHDNAVYSAKMLEAEGVRTVLLVTHDIHERRAMREFAATGLSAIPAPVSMAPRRAPASISERLPNAGALVLSTQALHEIIGTAILAPRTAEVR